MAQAYAHPIVPLCHAARRAHPAAVGAGRDHRRSVTGGGAVAARDGVSPATLEAADRGSASATRSSRPSRSPRCEPRAASDEWTAVDRESWTRAAAYCWRHRDGSGRTIAIGVFDGPLSRAVAFSEAATGAESLAGGGRRRRATARASTTRGWCCALGRGAVGASQEVRRSDPRVRDAGRGRAARDAR